MLRRVQPAVLLACAAVVTAVTPSQAHAEEPVPANVTVNEQLHTVEVELGRDGATLHVTRSLFNPTLFQARVELPIPLPCEALLDEFRVEELGPGGFMRWRDAELLSAAAGRAEFDRYFGRVEDPSVVHVVNADSAMLLTRDDWSCDAALDIYPVPPIQRRTFAYRLFVPSVYADGRYTIELPQLDGYGMVPELQLDGTIADELDAIVDQHELDPDGERLAGERSHTIVLRPRDAGRGRVRAVDLDVDALVRRSSDALALLGPDPAPLPRTLGLAFEAPSELAVLPPVRRAVVLIDGSRSISDAHREQLQSLAGAYFGALSEHDPDAEVEVVVFDREVHRVYHDFVPARWGAEDIEKLEIASANGSEVGQAMAFARDLLAAPSTVAGADWIIVLSDLNLRNDFDLAREQELAAASSVRVHVVRDRPATEFFPAPADDPWTALARAAGGMAWDSNGNGTFADELVSPRRIWNFGMELELADGSHDSATLDPWLAAGSLRELYNDARTGAALTRAGFVGEVWGQRRAWTTTPSELDGQRFAGALATNPTTHSSDLSQAVLTAFALHARVVTAYTSAWALAEFGGTAPAPSSVSPYILGCGSIGSSSFGCGGSHGCRIGVSPTSIDFATLAREAVSHCRPKGTGSYEFETTDLEIVAVASQNRCLTERTWATDIGPTNSSGRKRVTVGHANGAVTSVQVTAG